MSTGSLHSNSPFAGKNKYVFLVLILSGKKCTLFKYDGEEYHRLKNGIESISEVINDAPQRVGNFADPEHRKQVTIEKFIKKVDKWLGSVTKVEHLPAFLLAPEKVAGHFKKISKHDDSIIANIHGNFDDITIPQLKKLLAPYIDRMTKNKKTSIDITRVSQ